MVQVKSLGHYKVLSGKIKQHQGQGWVGGLLFRVGKGDVILSFVCLLVLCTVVFRFSKSRDGRCRTPRDA